MSKTLLSSLLFTLICPTLYADTPALLPSMETNTTPIINCLYHIPATTTTIEQSVLSQWAEAAATQSFDFNHEHLSSQLTALKPCYTHEGWKGFKEALKQSGNLTAIKEQKLTVSSQINGDITITSISTDQWKVSLPMQVVYQNQKQRLTQQLNVVLMIGRQLSGDLGVMQMLATPQETRQTNTQ